MLNYKKWGQEIDGPGLMEGCGRLGTGDRRSRIGGGVWETRDRRQTVQDWWRVGETRDRRQTSNGCISLVDSDSKKSVDEDDTSDRFH